ncbi:MAG: hypothetical protein ACFFD4_16705 [Candidatus Odinarchaeota archaeon]
MGIREILNGYPPCLLLYIFSQLVNETVIVRCFPFLEAKDVIRTRGGTLDPIS